MFGRIWRRDDTVLLVKAMDGVNQVLGPTGVSRPGEQGLQRGENRAKYELKVKRH